MSDKSDQQQGVSETTQGWDPLKGDPNAIVKSKKQKTGWYYRLSFSRRTSLWGIIFLTPWLIGFLAFFVRPIIELVRYSLSQVTIQPGGMEMSYIGWGNFEYVLNRHATFNQEILMNLAQSVPSMLLILIFSLIVAIILNGRFKGRSVARAIFFIPIIMATDALNSVVGGAQISMIQGQQGDVLTGVNFLSTFITRMFNSPEISTALLTAVAGIFDTVLLSGVQTLIFLGGLQAISPSLYEVAKIEGSTTYETFWKVTLPILSPLILTAAVYTLAEHFMRSPVVTTAYQTAFGQSQWGYSAAMSVIFLAASVLVIGVVSFIISRKVFYYD